MKKVKSIILLIIIIVAFIFSGELYVYNLDSFQSNYVVSSFAINSISDLSLAKKEFIDAADKNNLGIFALSTKLVSENEKLINIYANEKALDYLNKNEFLQKSFRSLFVGEINVVLNEFLDLEEAEPLNEIYFTDSNIRLLDMREFKKELIDKYGGGFPKDYGTSKVLAYNQIFIWSVVLSLFSLITAYEIKFKKKENFIRLIHGEDIYVVNAKNLFIDQITVVTISVLCYLILSKIYYIQFTLKYLIYTYIIQALICVTLYYRGSKISLKKDTVGAENSKGLLTSTYLIKIITLVITINILVNNSIIIYQKINYKKQYNTMKDIESYNYYQLNYKIGNLLNIDPIEGSARVHYDFYNSFLDNALLMVNLSDYIQSPTPIVLMNEEAMNFQIDNKIYTLKDKTDNEVIILRSEDSIALNDESYIDDIIQSFFPNDIKINDTIYSEDIEIVAINDRESSLKSSILKNPTIILDLNSDNFINDNIRSKRLYYAYSVLYNIDKNEFNQFVKEQNLGNQIVAVTNSYNLYNDQLMTISRTATLVTILSILLLILESVIILLVVQLEYSINKKELAIKKVLGYNFIEKNRRILITQVIATIISLIIVMGTSLYLGNYDLPTIVLISLIIFLIETVLIVYVTKENEKLAITNILKGASS